MVCKIEIFEYTAERRVLSINNRNFKVKNGFIDVDGYGVFTSDKYFWKITCERFEVI